MGFFVIVCCSRGSGIFVILFLLLGIIVGGEGGGYCRIEREESKRGLERKGVFKIV